MILEEQFIYQKKLPRTLRSQSLAKKGLVISLSIFVITVIYIFILYLNFSINIQHFLSQNLIEISLCLLSLVSSIAFYFYHQSKSNLVSIQVFDDHWVYHFMNGPIDVYFNQIEKIEWAKGGHLVIILKNNNLHRFDSSLERLDYLLEALYQHRSDLFVSRDVFEKARLDFIQNDHHHKRQLWFIENKLANLVYWTFLPLLFLYVGYSYQGKHLEIHQIYKYFFRLGVFSFFVLIICSLVFSEVLRFYLNFKIKKQIAKNVEDKTQHIDFEKNILKQSKYFQILVSIFIFSMILQHDLNFYSLTHVAESKPHLGLERGHYMIDNRFNCTQCAYELIPGDIVIFGKGYFGKVLAMEEETIAQLTSSGPGRTIASEKIVTTPKNHIAIYVGDKSEKVIFIKISDLVGKIKKP